jgi:hypothetical protein
VIAEPVSFLLQNMLVCDSQPLVNVIAALVSVCLPLEKIKKGMYDCN